MSDKPKAVVCEAQLRLSVFYDAARATPDELAEYLDGLLRGAIELHKAELLSRFNGPHINKLHVEPELTIIDGKVEDQEQQDATMLVLKERGCEYNVETVVLNDHKQAWLRVYLEHYDDKLRLLAYDMTLEDRSEYPIVDQIICSRVSHERTTVILDHEKQPMAPYTEQSC